MCTTTCSQIEAHVVYTCYLKYLFLHPLRRHSHLAYPMQTVINITHNKLLINTLVGLDKGEHFKSPFLAIPLYQIYAAISYYYA